MGYTSPPDPYNPLRDEAIPPEERASAFAKWVSGYYTHEPRLETFEKHTPAAMPPPTISTMKLEETRECFETGPSRPGGSDHAILWLGIASGVNKRMRELAFYSHHASLNAETDPWTAIPLRYLGCECSVYEIPWGTKCLRAEIEERKESGCDMRSIHVVTLPGANHFVSLFHLLVVVYCLRWLKASLG